MYEVELDLKQWEGMLSTDVPGFSSALIELIPSTVEHRCFAGQPGGFHTELARGTGFGHVVEHVLLELIQLAGDGRHRYKGWTKNLGGGRCLIHYGAPDYLTGRLAAILAVDMVSRLQRHESLTLKPYLEHLRDPVEYFTRDGGAGLPGPGPAELDLGEGAGEGLVPGELAGRPALSDWQRDNIVRLITAVQDRLPVVNQRWRQAFLAFGGEFAAGIADKVECLNPDKFFCCYRQGNLDRCFQGMGNIARMLKAVGIPREFVLHSLWLYKNHLQPLVLAQLATDAQGQIEAIGDLDDFFQNILHAAENGYRAPEVVPGPAPEPSLCGFRSRQVRCPTVLVVDDDTMARKVSRSILERRGVRTLGARDGLEALSIMAEENGGPGLVLLDLVMPGLDGEVTFRRLRESYPHCRVILVSGYPLDRRQEAFLEEHEVEFLAKPFTTRELLARAKDLLDLKVTGRSSLD